MRCVISWHEGDRDAEVISPFAAKDVIKDTPGRYWDSDRRRWFIPVAAVSSLKNRLEAEGFAVDIAAPQPGTSGDWVEDLFAAIPPEARTKVYRALAAGLHPDVGGDPELMKRINVIYDRYRP